MREPRKISVSIQPIEKKKRLPVYSLVRFSSSIVCFGHIRISLSLATVQRAPPHLFSYAIVPVIPSCALEGERGKGDKKTKRGHFQPAKPSPAHFKRTTTNNENKQSTTHPYLRLEGLPLQLVIGWGGGGGGGAWFVVRGRRAELVLEQAESAREGRGTGDGGRVGGRVMLLLLLGCLWLAPGREVQWGSTGFVLGGWGVREAWYRVNFVWLTRWN
ncbi:hypothetical protein B0T22DRAFT_145963 [Podospora appendiculata]|uniref:Uncharacterized protein n=1 Tax=Podospora appendiculata TaxID=314037 RepID=A0AAE0X8P5_9PEZI|nr:hypothetical protein B0T22DRAFT_145963 [Podospora appendiculata]